MSIVEIFKPSFETFHGEPVIMFQEPKGPIRVVVNLFTQYMNWLNAWTDPFRDIHAPGAAFWESGGPQICRALRNLPACAGLFFDWESDRKVAYRWITRKPESPIALSIDRFCLCPVEAEVARNGEGRVIVTLPTDEDVSFYFHASMMKDWLKPKKVEDVK